MKKILIFLLSLIGIGANAQIVRAYSMQLQTTGPFLSFSGTYFNFSTVPGTASSSQSVTVSGINLTANAVFTGTTEMELSKDGISWSGSVSYTPTSGSFSGLLYARIKSTATTGSYSGNITGVSTTASLNIPFSATVTSSPNMGVSTNTITNLNSTTGTAGPAQTFVVTFSNIAGSVTVNNFSPVEVSQDGVNFSSSISFSTGSPKTVYVRESASAPAGPVSGTIVVSASGVSPQNINVTGTVSGTSITPDSARFQFAITSGNGVTGWQRIPNDPSVSVNSGTISGTTITYSTVSTANWGQLGGASASANNGVTNATIPDATNSGVMREAFLNSTTFNTTNAQFITGGWKTDGTLYDIYLSGTTQFTVAAVGNYTVQGAALQPNQNFNGQGNTNIQLIFDGASHTGIAPDASGNFTFYLGRLNTSEQCALISYIKIKKHGT